MPVCTGFEYQKCKKEISKNDYMKNLPEFKALIRRYESITLDDIPMLFKQRATACKLTGFGDKHSCTLCKPLMAPNNFYTITDCKNCVYGYGKTYDNWCAEDLNSNTYDDIRYAQTPEQLLKAFKARAEHMRNILKEKGL
jgi:hypothetical protein